MKWIEILIKRIRSLMNKVNQSNKIKYEVIEMKEKLKV